MIRKSASESNSFGLQMFWEVGLLIAGFAACFSLEGAIGLKVILMLILIRSAFSWGELLALQKMITENHTYIIKQQGILQSSLYELREQVMRMSSPEREHMSAEEIESEFENHLNTAENSFEEALHQSKTFNDLLNQSAGSGDVIAFTGLFIEIGIAALIGWGLSLLL